METCSYVNYFSYMSNAGVKAVKKLLEEKEVKYFHDLANAAEIGATVIHYVEKEGSPLYEKSDYLITTAGGGYYFWYTVTLRFMYHAGQFPRYEMFFEELKWTGLSAMACVSWKRCSGCAQGPYRPLISSMGHWRLLTRIPL